MLEKSGIIVLTEKDLEEMLLGKVSDRVGSTWGLTLKQLQDVVDNNNYTLITS